MGKRELAGRVLFSCCLIISAFRMLQADMSSVRSMEELVLKQLAYPLIFLEKHIVVTDSIKINLMQGFIAYFAGKRALGGLLLLFDSPLGAYTLRWHLLISTPILYNFYQYNVEEPEFFIRLQGFMQNIAFLGFVLLYIEMKVKVPQSQMEVVQASNVVSPSHLKEKKRRTSSMRK